MKNIKDLNKVEAGNKLALVQKEIHGKSSKLNKSITIPILLCLEDAVENCQLKLKKNQVDKIFENNKEIHIVITVFFAQIYEQINNLITSILDNGFLSSSEIIDLPNLRLEYVLSKKFMIICKN